MTFSKDEMRKRFWRATAEKETIVAEAAPYREQYDALRARQCELQDEIREVVAKAHAIERPRLPDLDAELAFLAKGLGGKVGERK